MLFEFILRPLEEVQPWGDDKPTLHWFGLTDGWYWWNVGSQELFRNSQVWLDRWASKSPKLSLDPPYVDYNVVRPWEDLLFCILDILEPVLDDIILRTYDLQKWNLFQDKARLWMVEQDTDKAWDLCSVAFNWWSERSWDAGYLHHPPKIWLWAQGNMFHIRWDNRDVIDGGLPVWDAPHGEITMSVAEFVEEVKSFNDHLMSAMAVRVKAVVSGALRPNIEVDLVQLNSEQRDRATWLETTLTATRPGVDWDKVREALATLEQMCYNNGVEGP